LKAHLPEVYVAQIKKYEGRERLLEKKIPVLDCLWNDVLHLSPLNPQVVLDCWKQNGLYEYARGSKGPVSVFKIPAESVNWSEAICFQSFNLDFFHYNPEHDKYWKIGSDGYVEQSMVNSMQIEAWKADQTAGRRLLWFSHSMHVLVHHEIDIASCKIITCQ
jgi:hypothetical protein